MSYNVVVLFDGYSKPLPNGDMEANCSCTLITGNKNIIVDTMTPWDQEKIVSALAEQRIAPNDIDYVVSTHGHSDHTGNNNLFLNATHIVGFCISHKHIYQDHAFKEGKNYMIDRGVYVMPTPGHTMSCVSVVVENVPNRGTVVIAGDLFENEHDRTNSDIWKDAGSEDEVLQETNRKKVLSIADWVVPGHGKMFSVNK